MLTPDTRAALQQLLFADTTPEHSLGEAVSRYTAEYLDLGTSSAAPRYRTGAASGSAFSLAGMAMRGGGVGRGVRIDSLTSRRGALRLPASCSITCAAIERA